MKLRVNTVINIDLLTDLLDKFQNRPSSELHDSVQIRSIFHNRKLYIKTFKHCGDKMANELFLCGMQGMLHSSAITFRFVSHDVMRASIVWKRKKNCNFSVSLQKNFAINEK